MFRTVSLSIFRNLALYTQQLVDWVWNVMAHAQKPDFVFWRNGRVDLSRQGRQFSRLLAAEVCESAVVMLDTQCSEVVWRVLDTHSIHQFPFHFPSRALPCAITFQLESICHTGYADCLLAGSEWSSILIPLASSQHNLYDIYLLLCVQC
jgi:hypothetical protein